jgi:hypothetical protein
MRIAEMLRTLDISGFKRSGIMKHDVERFCNEYAHFSTNNPFMVGLRLAFGDTITVHTITGGVCGKIRNTRIEHLPNGQPAFLKKPFLLEAQKGESLINNIHTIGGYIDEESNLIIISWFTDGSFLVQREAYAFVGMSLSDLEFTNATDYEAGGKSENKNTLLFITILALMLEAERTPIQVSDTSGVKKNKHNKPAKNESNGGLNGAYT